MNSIIRKITLSTLAIAAFGITAFAQGGATVSDPPTTGGNAYQDPVNTEWKPSLVPDGAYDRVAHVSAPLAWQPLREADIMWKKRVWREIDVRQKQNMPFTYPGDAETGGGMFIEILLDAVKKGKIKAYSTVDDRFTTAMSTDQLLTTLVGKVDTTPVEDPVTGEITYTITRREFDPLSVTKFRVKEDWMMDRNLGRMVSRIIGIAPMIDRFNEDGSYRASAPMMWIYYPEARNVLANYEVYNPENDVQRLTWDDYLEGRFWSGRVIATSNPMNATFENMGYDKMEALYRGQEANEEIINKELDMWSN